MNEKLVLVITVLVLIIAAAAWLSGNNLQTKQCGNVVLQGYLVTLCTWQAVPSLPDIKPPGYDRKCYLDVWLSESAPTGDNPEACREQPITSWCFLEKIKEPLLPPYSATKITLIGNFEKTTVCTLLDKHPPSSSCAEIDVFVPCEVTKTAS